MVKEDMRGLTQYIADLRACRVRELEEKRINKEMAHIRQKFKGTLTPGVVFEEAEADAPVVVQRATWTVVRRRSALLHGLRTGAAADLVSNSQVHQQDHLHLDPRLQR
jgi:hypothetical protein